MCPSSWKLYLDDFPFFGSSLACLEPELELFEVLEINVRQIIIIANGINSQTSNSFCSGSRRAREELKKGKSYTYNFQDDGHISSCPVVHVYLQEACNPTSKYAKNSWLGVEMVKIMVL